MPNPRRTRQALCLPGVLERLGVMLVMTQRRPRGQLSAAHSRDCLRSRKLDARCGADDQRVGVRSRVSENFLVTLRPVLPIWL